MILDSPTNESSHSSGVLAGKIRRLDNEREPGPPLKRENPTPRKRCPAIKREKFPGFPRPPQDIQ
jgi:hypothetical protein